AAVVVVVVFGSESAATKLSGHSTTRLAPSTPPVLTATAAMRTTSNTATALFDSIGAGGSSHTVDARDTVGLSRFCERDLLELGDRAARKAGGSAFGAWK
ncbi:unnamed protein product, partial [Musa acuminata subsp. burmannicoides]